MSTVVTWTSFFPTSVLNVTGPPAGRCRPRPGWPRPMSNIELRSLGLPAQTITQFRVRCQPLHGLGKERGIAGRHEEGVDLVLQDLGDCRRPREATMGSPTLVASISATGSPS